MSRLTIEEAIKERIRYDGLNDDIGLIPKWLDDTTIPRYDEYKKCFLDGVNCKRYTDLKIVTDVLQDLEEQGRLIEQKHGQWKQSDSNFYSNIYFCSNCLVYERIKTVMGKPAFNYCPNCGAKMNEVEND